MGTVNQPPDIPQPRSGVGSVAVSGPSCVLAVVLTEGDLFLGGETVVTTRRDRQAGTVEVFTDDGDVRYLGEQSRVVLAHRADPRNARVALSVTVLPPGPPALHW